MSQSKRDPATEPRAWDQWRFGPKWNRSYATVDAVTDDDVVLVMACGDMECLSREEFEEEAKKGECIYVAD